MANPDFSIIIVTWNALHHLKTFLPSVREHSGNNCEIIIADNASTDGTSDWVCKNYHEVRVVTLDRNYGYCGGNNRAVPHARSDNLIFLNNDVEVTPDWTGPMKQIFDSHSDIAAVQPKMLSWKNRRYFEYAGAAGGLLDRFAYPFCRGRIFDTLETDEGQYDNEADIAWASGAAFAIRKDLFLQCGGFDESFEFHMEEIDLCWQLWNRGYRIRYTPDSVVYHLGGGSLPAESPRKLYFNYRNNLKMIWKNSATGTLAAKITARLTLDMISLVHFLAGLKFKECYAVIRAHLHFYRSIPQLTKQRKNLVSRRVTKDDGRVLAPLSIIRHYFLANRNTYQQLPGLEIDGQSD